MVVCVCGFFFYFYLKTVFVTDEYFQGHYDDLRGLTIIASPEVEGNIITAGQDGIICWYDTDKRDPVCKLVLKVCFTTIVDIQI